MHLREWVPTLECTRDIGLPVLTLPPRIPAHAVPDAIAQELLAIAHAAPLLVFLFDGDDRLRYANDAFRTGFALPEGCCA